MSREIKKKGEDKINEDIYLFDLSTVYDTNKVDNIGNNKVLIFSKILEIFKETINMIIDNKNVNIKNENNKIKIDDKEFNTILKEYNEATDKDIKDIYENLSDKDIIYILFFDIINNITLKFDKIKDRMVNKNQVFIDFIKYLNDYIVPKINFLIKYLETNEGTIKDFIKINDEFYNIFKTPDDILIEKIENNKKEIKELCEKINEINDKYNKDFDKIKAKVDKMVKEFNDKQTVLLNEIDTKEIINIEYSNTNIKIMYNKYYYLCNNFLEKGIFIYNNDINTIINDVKNYYTYINNINKYKSINHDFYKKLNKNIFEDIILKEENNIDTIECKDNINIIINNINIIINKFYSVFYDTNTNKNIFEHYYNLYIKNSKKYMNSKYVPNKNDNQRKNNYVSMIGEFNTQSLEFKKKLLEIFSTTISDHNKIIGNFNTLLLSKNIDIKYNIKKLPHYNIEQIKLIDKEYNNYLIKAFSIKKKNFDFRKINPVI